MSVSSKWTFWQFAVDLRIKSQLCDVEFQVEDGAGNKKILLAHKLIMMFYSSYLHNLLSKDWRRKVYQLNQVSHTSMQSVMQLLYKEISLVEFVTCKEAVSAAQILDIDLHDEMCNIFLRKHYSGETLLNIEPELPAAKRVKIEAEDLETTSPSQPDDSNVPVEEPPINVERPIKIEPYEDEALEAANENSAMADADDSAVLREVEFPLVGDTDESMEVGDIDTSDNGVDQTQDETFYNTPTGSRFNEVDDDYIDQLLAEKQSKSTKAATKLAVKILYDYFQAKSIHVDLDNISSKELCNILKRFYLEVRAKDGEEYKASSYNSIKFGLSRYFKEKGFDILTEKEFFKANEVFSAKVKQLRRSGQGTVHKAQIEMYDLIKVYSALETIANATDLQRKVWLDINLFLVTKGKEHLWKMSRQTFLEGVDEEGKTYISLLEENVVNSQAARMYQIPDCPLCPVLSFRKYMSKLCAEQTGFWQSPKKTVAESDAVWYCNLKLGEKSLGKMMSQMSLDFKLSHRYTNHCLKRTIASYGANRSNVLFNIVKDVNKTTDIKPIVSNIMSTSNSALTMNKYIIASPGVPQGSYIIPAKQVPQTVNPFSYLAPSSSQTPQMKERFILPTTCKQFEPEKKSIVPACQVIMVPVSIGQKVTPQVSKPMETLVLKK